MGEPAGCALKRSPSREARRQSRRRRAAHDDRRAGRARPQPEEHLGRDPARQPHRRHRPLGLGQVEPGVRHDLRRGAAALHGVALELRQALRRAGGEAGRRLRLRPVAGDLDRAEDARQQPALDRRHDDRHRQLPEPAVRDDRRSRTARAPASRRRAGSSSQILEAILSLPEGTEIELRAPVFKVYGEELDFVFTEVRKKGCRRLIVDGKPVDISERGRARRVDGPAHGRGRRPLRRQPEAREGDQGRDRRDAAGRRRADAGPRRQGREQGGGRAVLQGRCAARRTTSSTATSGPSTSCSTTPRAPAGRAAASASTS